MMQALRATPASVTAAPTPRFRKIKFGGRIYSPGMDGIAWRVKSGAVRLDRICGAERSFAGLALCGDVIGAETLLFGHYSFEACAIGDCELEPWLAPDSAPSGESVLQMLAATERRAADALALRAGEASDRVRRLCLLLTRQRADGRREVAIPSLKDMAEITNLTMETVSRAMSRLRRSGLLQRQGRRHGLMAVEAEVAPAA